MALANTLKCNLVAILEEFRKLSNEVDEKTKELAAHKSERTKLTSQRLKAYSELDAIERKKEEFDNKISANTKKIIQLQKSASECQKNNEILKPKLDTQDLSIQSLIEKTQTAKTQEDSMKHIYTETLERLQDTQLKLDKSENYESERLCVLKELQREKSMLENKLRSVTDSEVSQTIANLNTMIEDLSKQLETINRRTRSAECTSDELGVELSILEEEAVAWRERKVQTEQHLRMIKTTVQDMY